MAAVNIITGSYPTEDPTHASLSGKTVSRTNQPHKGVDVKVVASSGSGTGTLIGWDGAHWVPIGDITINSASYGGVVGGRFTPGNGFKAFAIWEKSAGATITAASLTVGDLR